MVDKVFQNIIVPFFRDLHHVLLCFQQLIYFFILFCREICTPFWWARFLLSLRGCCFRFRCGGFLLGLMRHTCVKSNTLKPRGLDALLDKMSGIDHVKLDNIEIRLCFDPRGVAFEIQGCQNWKCTAE